MLRLVLAATLLVLTGAAPPKPDWTRTVTTTATGWVVGNPRAPRKLVEYLSLNCPHCAAVSREVRTDLRGAVRTGRTSWEIRPMGLFPHDVPATLLARCVPPGRRLEFVEAYFREVPAFTERLQASQASADGVGALRQAAEQGAGALAVAMADLAGMKPLAARFGLVGAPYQRCLTDPKGHAWFDGASAAARRAGVSSTPTFFLGGSKLSVSTTQELRDAIVGR